MVNQRERASCGRASHAPSHCLSVRREAYKELGRSVDKASVVKRKQKQLSTPPTLPIILTDEASVSNLRIESDHKKEIGNELLQ